MSCINRGSGRSMFHWCSFHVKMGIMSAEKKLFYIEYEEEEEKDQETSKEEDIC